MNETPAGKMTPASTSLQAIQPLQWHPAFYAGIQIELEKDAANLIFENEHQLGTKPKEIDVLIIKKASEIPVQTNLGRIFRKHNIVEYKCPTDYLSIDDFYKVYGYACFYKADATLENTVDIREITITFVCQRFPKKLATHLKNVRDYQLAKYDNGIYYVLGDFIPIQIIVVPQLSAEKNLWLSNLTDRMKDAASADKLAHSYAQNKNNKLYISAMDMIIRANRKLYERSERDMCDAFFELNWVKERMAVMEKEAAERGMARGMAQGVQEGIQQCIRSVIETCQELGLVLSDTRDRIKTKFTLTDEAADAYLAQYWK